MTTHLIAKTLIQLNTKHEPKGEVVVWSSYYKFIIGYNCEDTVVWIKEVFTGSYLSNDVKPSCIPEELNVSKFTSIMIPLLALRHMEMIEENKRHEERRQEQKQKIEDKKIEKE